MVSIKDVATEAGVAISTVSKVLNNYPNISKSTKEKVNAAINRLGFVPNAVAQALSSKSTGRIAILVNQSRASSIDEISIQYLSGAILKAKELKLDAITLFFSMLQDKTTEEIITYLKSQSVEALAIFGLSKGDEHIIRLIEREAFKVVLSDSPFVNSKTSSVHVNQYEAQMEVAKELIQMNTPKSMLYLSGRADSFVSEEREKAIKALCRKEKLKLKVECADFSEKKARSIVLKYAEDYDCVVCASDLCAIGAMRALIDMDIFRPVCGFDGLKLMGYAGKQMMTVKQDFVKIGSTAIEECLRLLSGEEGRAVIIPYEIVRLEYLDVIC